MVLGFVLGCSLVNTAGIFSEEQMPPILTMESPSSDVSFPTLVAEEQMPPILHSNSNVC